jgi:hypothetical protein
MSTPSGDYRIINLAAENTEAGWGRSAQAAFERAAAAWFTWIGWLTATGALAYLAERTGDPLFKVLAAVSLLAIWIYFQAFFGSLRIEPWTSRLLSSKRRGSRILLLAVIALLSVIPTLLVQRLVTHAVDVLRANSI